MAPSKSSSRRGERLRALPWAAIARVLFVVSRRVGSLSSRDRQRLARLLRESRGWPGRLAERDRRELQKLLGKLDLRTMGRELLPLVRGGGVLKRSGKRG
jgi:hypothetical protein